MQEETHTVYFLKTEQSTLNGRLNLNIKSLLIKSMKKIVIPSFALFCFMNPHFVLAKKGPGTEKAAIVAANEKIKSESKHSQVMDIAFQLTDVSGSRLTVSPGFTRAANWA